MKVMMPVVVFGLITACAAAPPRWVTHMRELKQQCFREQMALHGHAQEQALLVNEMCHRWAADIARP